MAGRARAILALAAVPALLAALAASPAGAASQRRMRVHAAGETLLVGTQTLKRCGATPLAYCGSLAVPLDYSAPAGPSLKIAYRWFPATGAGKGTVVPVEGGPGYASTGSVQYSSGGGSAGYAPMYGPLLARWNMLVVDNRGTGHSTVLNCKPLQEYSGPTATTAFQSLIGECGEALDRRWRYPGGGYVHASDLFTSAPAAADLAAVLRALAVGKIDLYGDSYGSFFAQVFAARYPRMVRSLTLDSTYPVKGLDPWYRSSIGAMPANFKAACSRAPACAAATSGTPWETIGALAARLRASAVAGVVPGPAGKLEKVTIGVVGLVDLVNDAAEDQQVYRELDAAARALLGASADPAPLLRLYAQRLAVDEAYFGRPVREYSVGLYLATGCLDYPQLFDMNAVTAVRAAQLQAAEAALPGTTYSPFTTPEWLAQDQNTESYSACLRWPAPVHAQPPTSTEPPLLPPSLPVLVLGGELDSWTPPADVPRVLAELGGQARFVELANSTHVVGEGATLCAASLVRAFVAKPSALATMDASCAPAVPAIHAVGVYASMLADQPPLTPSAGSAASPTALRLAAAAVQTAGDALVRYQATEAETDRGLHGGSVVSTKGGRLLTLSHDQLIPGVPVSGTVSLSPAAIAEDGETAVATLTVGTTAGKPATFTAIWTTSGSAAVARVSGAVAGATVTGTMPAP